MKIEIIKDEEGWNIGWSMEGENKDEIDKLAQIRDLQFFGFDDTHIKYDGRVGGDSNGNPGVLTWKQKKHTKLFKQGHKNSSW